MRTSVLFAALLLATSVNAGDWLELDENVSLPRLVADGYQVVGFSSDGDPSQSGDADRYRFNYVLQKGTSIVTCSELRWSSTTIVTLHRGCQRLREPNS